jgi:hypothetical protein
MADRQLGSNSSIKALCRLPPAFFGQRDILKGAALTRPRVLPNLATRPSGFCYQPALYVRSGKLLLTSFTKLQLSLYCEYIILLRL